MHHYLKFLLFTGWGLFLREPGRHCRIPTPRDTADVIDSAIDLEGLYLINFSYPHRQRIRMKSKTTIETSARG